MVNNKKDRIFHYKTLKIFLHSEVYEPSEDTFFFLEHIDIKKDQSICEIGTGSGIIALSCAQKGASVVCSDINPYAIELVQKNIQENLGLLKGRIEVRQGDLFDILFENETFDIIIFNPPYLPTRIDQRVDDGGWFDRSVDGGTTGLETTKRYLKNISKHLKTKGKGYFIFTTQSDRMLLNSYLKRYSLKDKIVSTLKFENETLELHEITL